MQCNYIYKKEEKNEALVTEVGDISETQRKGYICRWKPLPSTEL
jgi:hypothetical protein